MKRIKNIYVFCIVFSRKYLSYGNFNAFRAACSSSSKFILNVANDSGLTEILAFSCNGFFNSLITISNSSPISY